MYEKSPYPAPAASPYSDAAVSAADTLNLMQEEILANRNTALRHAAPFVSSAANLVKEAAIIEAYLARSA